MAVPAAARAGGDTSPPVPGVPSALPDPFAVMAFENRSGVQGLAWMSAGGAFLVAEKAESCRALRSVYDPMVVPPGPPVPINADAVAKFADRMNARWIFTGWIARPNWELQLGVALWKVDGGKAAQVAEVIHTGEFAKYSDFAADAVIQLIGKAGLAMGEDEKTAAQHKPSNDFYAYTVFGRGLSAALGTEATRDAQKAQKAIERSVFIDPKMTEAQRILAELYAAEGKDQKARGRLAWALSLRPDYYPAILSSAALARHEGKLDQAIDLWDQALRQRPWDLEARYQLGRALWDSGDADGAYREMSRVVEHRPDDIRARRVLVLVHASRGDNEDLVTELEAVTKLDPSDEATRMDLAAAYAAAGRLDDAMASYQKIADRDPHQVQAYKFLGDLAKRQGKPDDAIRYYGQALKANPNDPRAYFLLGAAYSEQGNDKEAKKVYEQAEKFKKLLPETYNNLSAISYREGDLATALWYSKRAVSWKPTSARFRYNYALALSASKYTDRALEEVDAALKMEPSHVELHFLRGVILLRKGRADDARAEFEKTLALDAKHDGARHNIQLLDELKRRAEQGEIVIEGKQ